MKKIIFSLLIGLFITNKSQALIKSHEIASEKNPEAIAKAYKAIVKGDRREIKKLLDTEVDPDSEVEIVTSHHHNQIYFTKTTTKPLLLVAAEYNNLLMVNILLYYGANTDKCEELTKDTPLHITSNPDLQIALLMHDADYRLKNRAGKRALEENSPILQRYREHKNYLNESHQPIR